MSGTGSEPRSPRGPTAIASSPWIVVSIGVVAMVGLLVVSLGSYRDRSPAVDAQTGPLPTMFLPELPPSTAASTSEAPDLSPRATSRPTPDRTAPRTPPPAAGAEGAPAPAAPPPALTARYRVLEAWDGGFIAEVRISSTSQTSRAWTARLAFPGGELKKAWVEDGAQGTVSHTDDGFSYRSGEDLVPGGSVSLQFEIRGGPTRPASCTVDGGTCRGL